MPTKPIISAPLAFSMLAALAYTPAAAQDQPELDRRVEEQIGVKLPRAEQEELLAHPEAGPFGPAERPMGGYVALPAGWSAAEARPWVEKAFAHVAALPPKKK